MTCIHLQKSYIILFGRKRHTLLYAIKATLMAQTSDVAQCGEAAQKHTFLFHKVIFQTRQPGLRDSGMNETACKARRCATAEHEQPATLPATLFLGGEESGFKPRPYRQVVQLVCSPCICHCHNINAHSHSHMCRQRRVGMIISPRLLKIYQREMGDVKRIGQFSEKPAYGRRATCNAASRSHGYNKGEQQQYDNSLINSVHP